MSRPLLTVENACLQYPGEFALSGVSLELCAGEMASIVGHSGCGKTSLLYAIAGLRQLDSGTIHLHTDSGRCGLMFQDDRLLPWLTIQENCLLGLPASRQRTDTAVGHQEDCTRLLQTLRLSAHAGKYPDQLSGGQRQRAALARMLIRRPQLLLLDEPFAALDEQTREHLQDELLSYVGIHGITLLLVTHSVTEAVYLGSRIMIMGKSRFHAELRNPCHLHPDARDQAAFFETVRQVRTCLAAAGGDAS
ncbi:ABC transporter ATP-binding protein [Spirochaeta africana]|uniref:ABC-type nitrate/sulfonate/bicarbonate transport system, ATPase component n=1 Tax=Spirochaeta africana (strain ATCC 700263 / DSM 8902 / Z-7692) TaxID=889378 RepID=H9UK60_SPIAZ|nr:ABC transporter ATP-binding protein [Spirochaeta africana]AFG37903.1 ABC-type nitrate/sulfonate/bicarbonate transport system, ATPase component [Spirochaeta africana DSM 8902]